MRIAYAKAIYFCINFISSTTKSGENGKKMEKLFDMRTVKSYLRAFPFSLFVRMLPFGETNVPRDELTPVSVESLAAECII